MSQLPPEEAQVIVGVWQCKASPYGMPNPFSPPWSSPKTLFVPVSPPRTQSDRQVSKYHVFARSEATRQSPVCFPDREYEIAVPCFAGTGCYARDDEQTTPSRHLWGFFHYFRYFRCFLIAPNACSSRKTHLLRCEDTIYAYSLAQMF